jgi:hypothetical protein
VDIQEEGGERSREGLMLSIRAYIYIPSEAAGMEP